MMPRLHHQVVYLNLSRNSHQTPEVFILQYTQVGSQLPSLSLTGVRKLKIIKGVLRNFSQNSPQGKHLCLLESLFQIFLNEIFGREFFKRGFGTCFPVIFAKFQRTPFSQLLACSLGDCCFFLLIFISPSFHLIVIVCSQLAIGTLYILHESVLQLKYIL